MDIQVVREGSSGKRVDEKSRKKETKGDKFAVFPTCGGKGVLWEGT